MWPLGRSPFERRLRRLGRERFVDFVAALWTARGYETSVSGDIVVVADERGERRLWVHHQSWLTRRANTPPEMGFDAVVSNRPTGPSTALPGEPQVVDLDELYWMTRYSIPQSERSTLFRRVFDGSPGLDRPSPPSISRATLPVLLGVLLLAAGAVAGGVGGLGFRGGNDIWTPGPGGTTASAAPAAATATERNGAGSVESRFPPGVNESGIVDARALTDAHVSYIANRPYTLTLTYSEVGEGGATHVLREVARVAAPDTYVSRIERRGIFRGDPDIVADHAVYADGTTRYVRGGREEPVRLRPGGEGWYTDRVEGYLMRFLAAPNTTIIDVTRQRRRAVFRISLRAATMPEMRDVSGEVVVTSRGFVTSLRVTYNAPYRSFFVGVEFEYSAVGETTVERPEWYNQTAR